MMTVMPRLVGPAIPPGRLARLAQPVLDLTDMALRPWQSSDVSAVAAAYSDPDIRYWHARSMTEAEARVWIDSWPVRWAQESGAGWAIADEAGLLGQISLRRLYLSDGIAEVSYWVVPAARGRRVATRALSALTSWAFHRLGLHRLEVNHSTMNSASCRVAESAGYAMEGTKRGEALHPDGWHDMHLHARLSSDPPHEGRSSN
ncbi:GNAT family N-acetyltransferase [Pseudonocardia yunnanensis]|uniref:GNAT family N-acetyltransferase n=1 Tax=Pseudonocardia yunnanensis TaxID=58107 RepID=A0ABW4EL14_9PSEU